MCESWKNPSMPSDEINPSIIEKLPNMFFANVTGGEPFIRQDLTDFIRLLCKKSKRIVINTNGFFTERIIALCKEYPNIGIRLSIEGLSEANDCIRGMPEGFDRSIRTLFELRKMGMKDIGLNITVQDLNYRDLTYLYHLAYALDYEFATTTVHNSHYFHKHNNEIKNKEEVIGAFDNLIQLLLKSKKIKEWFRAYYNYGLTEYIRGKKRLLPCEMGTNGFFVDPFGDVLVCNGMDTKLPIGNINNQDWNSIWHGQAANNIRQRVKKCDKNCWMIGSAAPAIWHHPVKPILWVIKNKWGKIT